MRASSVDVCVERCVALRDWTMASASAEAIANVDRVDVPQS